jgi:glutamate 5-kinase
MANFDIELVGKIGSMALIDKEWKQMNYNIIARLSKELKPGYVWVTSGATEIGRLDFIKRNGYELEGNAQDVKTDYAAQGQAILMQTYRDFIDPKYNVRQILIENQHFNDEEKREYIRNLLLRCPAQNAIPIINYNDPVSNDEIAKLEIEELRKKGKKAVHLVDNDETASQVADLLKCKNLLIYTSTVGIYADPKDESTLIKEISGKDAYELIDNITAAQAKCEGASRAGANGAKAKLEYIKGPAANGTKVFIANPKYTIKDILSGVAPCTRIFVK